MLAVRKERGVLNVQVQSKRVGLARTVYIHRIFNDFPVNEKHCIYMVLANPTKETRNAVCVRALHKSKQKRHAMQAV